MDERFDKVNAEMEQHLGQIHKRMDNDKQTTDARFYSIMSILNKIAIQKGQYHTAIVHQVSLKTLPLSHWLKNQRCKTQIHKAII